MDLSDKKEMVFENEMGNASVSEYSVFPGVTLSFTSVHTDNLKPDISNKGTFVEIHHCREGRLEQTVGDDFFYLMPGDLSVSVTNKPSDIYNFPLRHYHGVTILINVDIAPKCFSSFLEDVRVQPIEVAKKLCGDKNRFILRNEEYVEHIFSELYSIPEEMRKGYFKIKILELLFVLNGIGPSADTSETVSLSKTQVRLAKQAAEFLSENMDKRVTIADLAKMFNVSDTYLKNAFKGVYGVPISSFGRIQKMQSAAQMLIHTDKSVSEVAYIFGYSNESKFTSAFKKIMGDNPGKYKKMNG